MVVGNIISLGGRYLEPQGNQIIINETTGETCEINYRDRGWMSDSKDQSIEAVIKDKNGVEKYTLTGKYNTSLTAQNIRTGEKITTYKVQNRHPSEIDPDKIFGFNTTALQVNFMSD